MTTWYADALGARRYVAQGDKKRSAIVRTLQIFRESFFYDCVVTSEGFQTAAGLVLLCLLEAITGRRRIVLLEFLPGVRPGRKGMAVRQMYRIVLPRSVAACHVLSSWEADYYSQAFGIAIERFKFIPWPLEGRLDRDVTPIPYGERSGVVASGRNSCDWETVCRAASAYSWKVTLICGQAEYQRVLAAAPSTARILVDISEDEHWAEVRRASVYILALQERFVSAGHVRLMTAIMAETPVVASDVRGLADYKDAIGVLVPAADYLALGEAVGSLLGEPKRAESIASDRRAVARSRSWDEYLSRIREFMSEVSGHSWSTA
ncbi:hypothetical protein [Pseudofrankia sp. DC12]|uniref:hypothetical protein n=1 Tax=Pseudofrankia sp. DC12 TaxID=683315 RepID=UPI0012FCCDE2|nr:hypothetical protein [Pseudofrankia sp. DC12]